MHEQTCGGQAAARTGVRAARRMRQQLMMLLHFPAVRLTLASRATNHPDRGLSLQSRTGCARVAATVTPGLCCISRRPDRLLKTARRGGLTDGCPSKLEGSGEVGSRVVASACADKSAHC